MIREIQPKEAVSRGTNYTAVLLRLLCKRWTPYCKTNPSLLICSYRMLRLLAMGGNNDARFDCAGGSTLTHCMSKGVLQHLQ